MSIKIQSGNNTAGQPNIDANYNLQVRTPTNKTQAGFVYLASQNDAGTVTGVADVITPRTSDEFRLSTGRDVPLFEDTFNATAQNTGMWKYTASTLACTQAGGFLNFNPTNNTTSGAYVSMQSYRYMPLFSNTDLHFEFSGGTVSSAPLAGQVMEYGLFLPNAAAAPTDGVYFRVTSAGIAGIAINNAGTEYSTAVWSISNLVANTVYEYKFILTERSVDFYVNNVEIGSISVAAGLGALFLESCLPVSMQFRNTSLIGGAGMSFHISDIHVDTLDMDFGKSAQILIGGMGRHGAQGQNGGTMGSTSNITNNMAKGTPAALSNTTIAAPACIGLGGRAAYLPTLTVYQDGILMSFQNPAGSVNQQPRSLYIGAIRINSFVGTVLAGGPLNLSYYIAYGHTAVSAATAEATSFTTGGGKAPRRVYLGSESAVATAAANTPLSGGVNVTLAAPIVVNPGEYVAILVTNIGVVTSSGDVVTNIGIGSWWE